VHYVFSRRSLPAIYNTGEAINYSAYRTAGGPTTFEVPTDSEILQDLALLNNAGYNLLRLFGAAPPATDVVSEKILQLANQHYPNIKFQLGVFLGGLTTCADPVNDKNIAYLITKLSKYPNVASISVGNETSFYSKYMPVSCLEGYIRTIRAQVSQPVTTDDDWSFYAGLTSDNGNERIAVKPDTILPLIDFASIHLYPFSNSLWDWKQTDIPAGTARAEKTMETSLDVAKDWYGRASSYIQPFASGMPIVVGETGWKARQTNNASELEGYLANPVNAKWYTDLLYGNTESGYSAWERSLNGPITIFYFEAFDESWKGTDDGWGLWDSGRSPRYSLCGVVNSVPCNQELYKDAGYYVSTDNLNIYTNTFVRSGFDSCPNWGQATLCEGEKTVAGFKALKYSNLNYQGLSWETNPLDVSSKTTLHMDLWTPEITSIKISLISTGTENAITKALTPNSWNSIDIPLSSYSANKSAILQIKLEAAGSGTVYVRNIYFTGTSSSPITVYSDTISTSGFDSCPWWWQATVCEGEKIVAGFKALKYSNLNYQGLSWETNPLDVSSKTTLHMDLWTPEITSIKISLISTGTENAITKALTPNSWNSIDIPLSSYSANKSAILQIKLEAAGSGTVYVRNIYFNGSSNPNVPTNTPINTIPSGAIAVYSNESVTAGFNSCPNWGQATVCIPEQTIAGNKVIGYSNLNYQGLDWYNYPIDVSAKTTLHVDFWTPNLTSIQVSLISAGPVENAYTQVLTTGSWNSVDIPLSNYIADKSAIRQIKLVASGSGTVYVDNIYFY